jgi:ribonuclease E
LEGYPDANLILRTACAYRTKVEIKRDFSYLNKSWENIKNATISSYAPALIHEEGDLIISGIKDFYTSDVEKIIVSGSEAYKKTKEFLKVFAPKNIDKLEEYNKAIPILHEYKVESQLQELYSSKVNLKSGGHLVIAPTEALVAIDVNSGTYTEKYSIEDTALNINLEAAAEIAKQIRFRGLSGLIVIDFIDMMDLQNKKHVEKVLKKAFWKDSVKVQLGKISEFGLLEMSRQRIGRSFMESNSAPCRRCSGIGKVIMTKSVVLLLMGKLKSVLTEGAGKYINIFASTDVILSLINSYKAELGRLEKDYKKHINLYIDDFIAPQEYRVISEKFEQSGIKNQRYAAPEIAIETDEVEEMPSSSPPQAAYKGAKRNKNKEFAPKTIFRKYNANTPRKNNNQKRFSNNAQPQPKKDAKEHTNLLKKIWKNITD